MLSFTFIIVLSYLIGSIPTSVWVGKLTKGVDIRDHGSGNAGATNTFRVLGWKAGAVVSLIDLSKGFVAAFYISQIGFAFGEMPEVLFGVWNIDSTMRVIAGTSAVIGHMYPLYANFKGGKGVITAAGMLYGIEPVSISLALSIFLIVMFASRYVSLASIIASISYPLFLIMLRYAFGYNHIDGSLMVISSAIALFIVVKHHGNIKRLMNGTENRVNSFAPAKGKLNEEQSA
ncbi:MAG: glycerol-3-phosphate 1-O-acyltransferase PlsY [Bacteroidetes bacterium]|nr:glycerol-3-phosphate 1-O-acyltransferase PlsY [Bacteroidota bacterium]MCH8523667.1 glycerol-3-phosphate 1-O-acyltransferase PlsY [Balneolales bacterium]